MRNSIFRTMIAGVTTLAMSGAVVLSTGPASAGGWSGGGAWHGGGGGWHGGGWGHPGWAWHSGYWRGGSWYNGWWGPAVAAGVVAGALATYPYWGGGYGYGGDGCWAYRATYDGYGNYLGQRWVNVCQ